MIEECWIDFLLSSSTINQGKGRCLKQIFDQAYHCKAFGTGISGMNGNGI